MGNGFQFIDIILLAMVAAFIVLRLRSVLGRRTGNERQRPDPLAAPRGESARERESESDKVVRLPDQSQRARRRNSEDDDSGKTPLDATLTRIKVADPSFEVEDFLEGSRSAFEFIVNTFAAGDSRKLKPLLSREVYDKFDSAIKAREEAGETLETTLVGFKKTEILEAHINGLTAYLTVKFVTEQINVTLSADGDIVEGDGDQISDVTDIWHFTRDTRSRDPNWTLVRTETPQ
ncbi:MAG: Tim44/TimA family putative adaptor protein [Alphaproteobacteria bacterium]